MKKNPSKIALEEEKAIIAEIWNQRFMKYPGTVKCYEMDDIARINIWPILGLKRK